MLSLRLAWSNIATRKVRTALTVAAIALSVSLVVSVTTGYASLEGAAYRLMSSFFASVDARIIRQNDSRSGVPESLLDDLRQDPAVASALGRIESAGGLLDRAGKPIAGRAALFVGITRPEDHRVESMELLRGAWFDASDGDVAVIDQVTAMIIADPTNVAGDESRPSVNVGDAITLPGTEGNLVVRVVGIVHKPKILAALQPSVYLPLRTLQRWSGPESAGRVSSILIDLEPEAEPAEFAARWRPRLKGADPTLALKLTSEQRGEIDKNLRGLRIGAFLGGAIAMLAATFIIFSALAMGVTERQRTLAMMRAIGAERRQLGRLVVLEAVLLAGLGVAIGIPLGLAWTGVLYWLFSDVLMAGLIVSWGGIAFAGGCALAAAVAASLLPAWGASRADPLEAMAPLAAPASLRGPMPSRRPGAALLSLDSLILFAPWRRLFEAVGVEQPDRLAREVAFYGHFAVGLPTLMLGFFLVAPLVVMVIERLIGPVAAWVAGVRPALLRQQLSGGVWRSAGTAAALMVGLAVLVVLQVQGNTVIGGWRIPDRFPDMFVTTFKLGGLSPDDVAKVRTVPGVRPDQVLPIAIASPEFGSTIFSIRGAATMPEATMFFGVEPRLALEMMQLDFRDGTAEQAVEWMTTRRRHVLVTEEFRQLKGLKTGDVLTLRTPRHGPVDYTIAGVVWSPGIDVIVSMFDLGRQFEQRTAASVFGTLEDARDDFGVEGVYLLALNLESGVQKEQLADDVQKRVGTWGLQAGDVRMVKSIIQQHFRQLIGVVSTVAFAAMAVASLGVANTMMASVRSRRWQFGVLRSIGVTRGHLLRLVLTEALLLGLAGCVLGLLAGGLMAANAKRLLLVMVGYDPPFTVPWEMIGGGAGVVVAVALLAGLWPAVSVARSEPLSLLQAGRASA